MAVIEHLRIHFQLSHVSNSGMCAERQQPWGSSTALKTSFSCFVSRSTCQHFPYIYSQSRWTVPPTPMSLASPASVQLRTFTHTLENQSKQTRCKFVCMHDGPLLEHTGYCKRLFLWLLIKPFTVSWGKKKVYYMHAF